MQDMTKPCLANGRQPNGFGMLLSLPGSLWDLMEKWYDRTMARRHLEEMSCYLLDDIGMSCEDMRRETNKPFWRP